MSGLGAPLAPAGTPRAWVVFCDGVDIPWLRLLRRGFRHCFVVLNDGGHWITVDPLAPLLEVKVAPVPSGYDLPGWFAGRGHTVVPAPVRRGLRQPAPTGPFTCVETCKRVLGVHARFLITPWQLFRHLTGAGHRPVAAPPALSS